MDASLHLSQRFSLQKWVPFLLSLTFLALPLSSSAKSICLSLTVLAILLTPYYRNQLLGLLAEKWCQAAILLFFIAVAACLWSPASFAEKVLIAEKYSKLLYLPILVVGFQNGKTRLACFHAYLLAMLFTSCVAILRFHGFLPLDINPDYVFRNHIMSGYMLDFAAYLCVLFFYRESGLKRWIYALMFPLLSYHVLFINGGRMGYFAYLMLMCLLVVQIFSWRQALAGLLIISAAAFATYKQSPYMNFRLNLIFAELDNYKKNIKDSPVGYRIQFHQYAYKLFNMHPILGNGTGSFTYYFRTEKPVPSWSRTLLEPHSQYWLAAVEFGLMGTAILLFFFSILAKASWKLDSMRPIAFATLLPFLMGNFSDSLLLYSGSGYFFILFMALCLSEKQVTSKTLI